MLVPFSIRWLCLSFMLIYSTGTARRVIYFEYTYIYILYMRGLYCSYCLYSDITVSNTFRSAPFSPGTQSGAVSGNYRGCKASVVQLCVRNLPCGGFAVLSAFQNNSPTCQRTLFYHYRNLWLLKTRLWSLALLNSLILSAVIALFLRMRSQLQAHCYQDVSEAQEQLLDKMQILRWRLLQRGNSYK